MAINFPNSPSLNDTYSENDTSWKWDGTSWNRLTGLVGTESSTLSGVGVTQFARRDVNNVITGITTLSTSGVGNTTLNVEGDSRFGSNIKVTGVSTFTGNIDANGSLDVDGHTELDNLNVSGVSTLTDLRIGNTNSIDIIRDEDDMASDDVNALATQQSIKAYVDTQVTAQDLDFAGDSGTGAVDLDSQSLTLAGTSNEIETSASGQTITLGLPNDVTIGNDLTVTGDIASVTNLNVTGVSTFTGISTFSSTLLTQKSVQIEENLNITGVSTFTGAIDANGDLDVDGFTELDDLNVSGITTTVTLNVGTSGQSLVGITTILDEDLSLIHI